MAPETSKLDWRGRLPRWRRTGALLCACSLLLLAASPALSQTLPGDLDGDGSVGSSDEELFQSLYGSVAGDLVYDASGDLDGDGAIDHRDLALFGDAFGSAGGPVDGSPPGLFVTLNEIPDDMNDVLVAPPELFQITLAFDSAGGSVVDPFSLSVTSSQDVGVDPAGAELAAHFTVSPSGAVFEVPAGSALALATHTLDVRIRDAAGNEANAAFAFAVRSFGAGPPLGNTQQIFLDFDQDRSLGAEVDLVEDLREFGLSTAAAPAIEQALRDRVIDEITERIRPYYGLDPDGTPGPDAVDIVFHSTPPGVPHTRICVGGQSGLGAGFLGASILDVNNAGEFTDECALGPGFGVFPNALDNLWGSDPEFQAAFGPLDPGLGGTPVGADPLDATVTAPGFDPVGAPMAEVLRWLDVEAGISAFSQAVATAAAHEVGHVLGLVAHGPTPGGLFGGDSGANTDHNVTPGGTTPAESFLMNAGGTFSFAEMTGRDATPLPVFRPLAWAYLRDRIAINASVTALLPPPQLASVTPPSVDFAGGGQNRAVTFLGSEFVATPTIDLLGDGDPFPRPVTGIVFVDENTVDGMVNKFAVPPNTYDVQFRNPDGQVSVLIDGLVVQ